MKMLQILLFALATCFAAPSFSEDQSTANMEILKQKVKADKKLLVAANMTLTDAEAKAFWPVYEAYQTELKVVNERYVAVITSYAKDYKANTLTDEKAVKLTNDLLAAEAAETKLKQSFVPKLSKVLSGKNVARYLQIENKIRAVVKYEIASEVPLGQ
jgi:hypothetical protein